MIKFIFILVISFQLLLAESSSQEDYIIENSDDEKHCRLGLCARWNIFIIPLFKIGFNHFENVERIIDTSIEDCRWKNYTLNIKFITKDLVFHDVVDPIQPIEIDDDLRVLSLYTEEEKNHAYTHALLIAEQMMSKATEEVGNFILLFTDSVRFTEDKVLLRFVDKALHSKFIQLRVVQLLYNDQKGSQKDIAKMVTKVTDNIGRISLYETHDLLESIKPCPALTNQQKLFQYGEVMKIRRYLYALEHMSEFVIGGLVFCAGVLSGILAYLYDCWFRKKLAQYKKKDTFVDSLKK